MKRALPTTLTLTVLALSTGTASAQAPAGGEGGLLDAVAGDGSRTGAEGPGVAGNGGGGDGGQQPGGKDDKPALRDPRLKLRIGGLRGGKLTVGKRFKAKGTLAPYVKGEKVTLLVKRGKKTIKRRVVKPKRKKGSNFSKFKIAKKQVRPGRYRVVAVHKKSEKLKFERTKSKRFKIRYPKLRQGNRSRTVKLFNRLLDRRGFPNDKGKAYDSATARAVLAFRKTNGMSWTEKASSKVFKKLAKGKGAFKVKHPESGKHVEIDLSRQVMALIKNGKAKEVYHVSTGAPATPTPTGTWRFYRKEPGYNNKAMYYSVYWYRGYATHGYKSVPKYPASHGCARNPPANSVHIYNWIDLGDIIHVYR